jgi:endonuclease/exonuclease/phosphatase family metal-dependent hydrolase
MRPLLLGLYYGSTVAISVSVGIASGVPLAVAFGVILAVLPAGLNRPQHLELGDTESLSEATHDATTIEVLSYNIFMRPSLWFVRNNANDWKNERLDLFINLYLSRFHVMCLQEIFSCLTLRQRKLINAAEKRGFKHAVVAGAAPFLVTDHHLTLKIPLLDAGLLILSKYPVRETGSHYYRNGALIDGYAPKQILWCLIETPRPLHIFNTHMQSTHTNWPREQADMARARQVEDLATYVCEKLAVHQCHALICGDFNLDAIGSPLEYERLMDILQRRVATLECGWHVYNLCGRQHEPTYGILEERILTLQKDWNAEMCIDYSLYIGPAGMSHAHVVSLRGGEFQELSDHRAVLSVIEI